MDGIPRGVRTFCRLVGRRRRAERGRKLGEEWSERKTITEKMVKRAIFSRRQTHSLPCFKSDRIAAALKEYVGDLRIFDVQFGVFKSGALASGKKFFHIEAVQHGLQ